MISEERRHEMYLKFEEVLGAQVASTVMEHLPPVGWADVATKRDLDAQTAMTKRDLDAQSVITKRDLDAFRAETTGKFAAVRTEMRNEFAAVRTEMTNEFATVRAEMTEGFGAVRLELRGEINRLLLWLFPTIVTTVALAFSVAKLS